ncbi:PEGA domain-containing protein [Persicimonas caeni]|uniref:PEGA domain-containing protein n=1 Tax=Persicimonas caeni TaxID=2292766 RepID=A0A4Y6PZN0_PERCE|nr:serine/threonine-protein kinase [Persicimonas caeni]QDG53732.1 PEGA domain-containing protein [Persicimonas caeni]QED34953.1 protein kinase [Persicimonas caeni]
MSEKYIIPTPGDTIAGKYHIEEELGRGAYGVVFRAHQTGISRHVALKTLLPKAFLETDIVERFEREAQFVGRLNHPNIVGVHDYGRHENLLYMAVEYVEGDTLDEIIAREGALEPDRVRKLVYQMVDALEHAHERGIVHRDLKPANIVILPKRDAETGEMREIVKVLDFGIAKLIQTETEEENYETLTQAGTVLGTPHYMSPETIVGDAIDHRADIYSLGVIMYEMLTGGRPFGAKNSPGVMVKHLRDKPPELPAHLERSCWGEAVRGCMEKKPEKRIQSALRVREILERRDESKRAAVPEGATAKAQAQPRPSTGRKGLIAAIVIGVLAAVGIAVMFQLIPGTGEQSADKARAAADETPETADERAGGPDEEAQAAAAASEADAGETMEFEADAVAEAIDADDDDTVRDEPPKIADRSGSIGTARRPDPSAKERGQQEKPDPKGVESQGARATADNGERKDQKADKVSLKIESTPPGARVLVDGRPAGTTPVDYKADESDQTLNLELNLIGYRTKFQKVVPDKDQTVRVELEKGRLKLIP